MFSLPDELPVKKGETSGGSITLDLDAGYYRIKVVKPHVSNWEYRFYHGMTADEWKILKSRKPRWVHPVFGTDSNARWKCTQCSEVSMTEQGHIMHEWRDHLGLDPLRASEEEIEEVLGSPVARIVKTEVEAQPAVPPLTRRPGRPRKEVQPEA